MERQSNQIEKITPPNGVEMPGSWYDWHTEMPPEVFDNEIPLKTFLEINFKHIEPNPVPLQPPQTEHKISFSTYFISPGKIIIYWKIEGFNFMFSDRFVSECRIELTQNVQPGAMDEPDPAKRLSMFSVDLKWYFRLHFLKSIQFIQGVIEREAKKEAPKSAKLALKGVPDFFNESIRKRLIHFLDPETVVPPP